LSAFEPNPARALRVVPPALKTFGRYEAHAEIGDGAMGRVYRGFDPMVGRFVAIKTVKGEYLTRETRAEYLRRFRREAQAAGRLAHPNIVSIFDVGEDYFVMEYVEGITLAELLRYRTALDVASGLRVLAPVAQALDYAHRCGVVHRDIKPANIMVQPDGRPKLMDFGVARLETSAVTSSGQFFGSPSYMAPEQILGSPVTHEADLFSFAVVAYEAFTGKRPYQGDSITTIIYRVVNESPAPPRVVSPELPPHFDEAFRRALSKQPSQRYATGMELIAALAGDDFETSLADLVPEPIPEARTPTLTQNEVETQAIDLEPARRRRRALVWAVPAAAAVALAVEIGLLARTAPTPTPPPEAPSAEAAPPTLVAERGMIKTEPAGALVLIDSRELGQSPIAMGDLTPGEHRLQVQLTGYAPIDFSFPVTAGAPATGFNFNLLPLSAPMRVQSDPPGALITVDGVRLGATPLANVPLSPGRHEVRIDLKGYRTYVKSFIAHAGQRVIVNPRLVVDATPLDALDARELAASVPPAVLPMPTPVPIFEGMFVDPGLVDRPPQQLSGGWATVPDSARQKKGMVEVEMTVTETGHPSDLTVTRSAGVDLDQAVLKALRAWRFAPAVKDGVKVRTRIVRRQEFR
jgi:serine/threonine-protein kinase